MRFGHEGGFALNEDQRVGHDEIGACLGALRGPLLRGEPVHVRNALKWLDTIEREVKELRERLAKEIESARHYRREPEPLLDPDRKLLESFDSDAAAE